MPLNDNRNTPLYSVLGPFVKASGFSTLLLTMSAIAVLTCIFVTLLPGSDRVSDAALV